MFVVQYRAPEWTDADPRGHQSQTDPTGELLGGKAWQFARELRKLGFETQTKLTEDHWFFSTTYHTTVSYRSVDWQERTFANEDEALAFRDSLPRGTESTIDPR